MSTEFYHFVSIFCVFTVLLLLWSRGTYSVDTPLCFADVVYLLPFTAPNLRGYQFRMVLVAVLGHWDMCWSQYFQVLPVTGIELDVPE